MPLRGFPAGQVVMTAIVLPRWDSAHHCHSVQYLLIWDMFCFFSPPHPCIFYHTVVSSITSREAPVQSMARQESVRAGLKADSSQPCNGCPISQHRTRALNKLVIIRSAAAAAVMVKMEFQPTSLSWGETGKQLRYVKSGFKKPFFGGGSGLACFLTASQLSGLLPTLSLRNYVCRSSITNSIKTSLNDWECGRNF